jgi:thymidylate synthase (FAD)
VAEGKCPEGKMTCGKINEVRNFFSSMKKGIS